MLQLLADLATVLAGESICPYPVGSMQPAAEPAW